MQNTWYTTLYTPVFGLILLGLILILINYNIPDKIAISIIYWTFFSILVLLIILLFLYYCLIYKAKNSQASFQILIPYIFSAESMSFILLIAAITQVLFSMNNYKSVLNGNIDLNKQNFNSSPYHYLFTIILIIISVAYIFKNNIQKDNLLQFYAMVTGFSWVALVFANIIYIISNITPTDG